MMARAAMRLVPRLNKQQERVRCDVRGREGYGSGVCVGTQAH